MYIVQYKAKIPAPITPYQPPLRSRLSQEVGFMTKLIGVAHTQHLEGQLQLVMSVKIWCMKLEVPSLVN